MSTEWIGRRLTGQGVLSGVNALEDPFSLFLVQCIIILTICRLLGLLGARFKQPKVIFEIIGNNPVVYFLTAKEQLTFCLSMCFLS